MYNGFVHFVQEFERTAGYVRPRAFGIGLASVSRSGALLDTWFPVPNHEANYGTAAVLAHVLGYRSGHATHMVASPSLLRTMLGYFDWCLSDDDTTHVNVAVLRQLQSVLPKCSFAGPSSPLKKVAVVCFIPPEDQDNGARYGVADAYLRLHLLSHRLVKPHGIKLDGIFGMLPNNYWTNEGPIAEEDLLQRRFAAAAGPHPLLVHSRDKFPRLLDYVQPDEVRIADASRVRLGAYLGRGTTVMHEGFVNFNAGTLGVSMVEGRISSGVVVGDHSDIGGGASTMGTLSGGGKQTISIGERCLIGANGGTGISLGDGCTIEAGLYVTAATKVLLEDGNIVKAAALSGQSDMLFIRDSQSGVVKMRRPKGYIELNPTLHANT